MKPLVDSLVNYSYVPAKNENNILVFQYKGVDRSLLYKYVLSPFAEFSLKFIPRTIAPNTITVISFMMVVIPHLLYMLQFGTNFKGHVPQWLMCLTVFMYYGYVNLDNMDGKQARRTGNSSSLGALLDHQMDSMVVMLEAMNVTTTMQFGPNIQAYLMFAIPASLFYLNTMEAYYTGILDLPIINGASEGAMSVGLFLVFSIINGPNWWQTPIDSLQGTTIATVIEILFVMFFCYSARQIYFNIKRYDQELIPSCIKSASFGFFIIYGTAFIIAFSEVSQTHTKQLFYLVGFTFSTQCGIMQLYHVGDVELPAVRLPGLILVGLPLVNTLVWLITKISIVDQGFLINTCALVAFLRIIIFRFSSNPFFDQHVQATQKSLKNLDIFHCRLKGCMIEYFFSVQQKMEYIIS